MHNLWYPGLSVAASSGKSSKVSKSKPPVLPRLTENRINLTGEKLKKSNTNSRGQSDSTERRFSKSHHLDTTTISLPPRQERNLTAVSSRQTERKGWSAKDEASALPRAVSCGVRRERNDTHDAPSPTRKNPDSHRPPPIVFKPHRTNCSSRETNARADVQKRCPSSGLREVLSKQVKECSSGASNVDSGISLLPTTSNVSPQCSSSTLAHESNVHTAVQQLLSCSCSSDKSKPHDLLLSGWLSHEPALEREVIYAPQTSAVSHPFKRLLKTSKCRKTGGPLTFKHLPSVESYMTDYLEHHSFTYTTVNALRPPVMFGGVKCSRESPTQSDGTGDGESDDKSTLLPTKAKGKNWLCLVKRTSTSQMEPNFILSPGNSEQSGTDGATGRGESRCSRPATCDNTGHKRTPLEDIMEESKEVPNTSSSISVGRYLIIKSKEDKTTKEVKDDEEDEGFGSASTGSIVNPVDSFIQECESGPSLSSDSHKNVLTKSLVENQKEVLSDIYKFPCFKPVMESDGKQKKASTRQVVNKARSLGLISPFVLQERLMQDIFNQSDLKAHSRTASCTVRREQQTAMCEGKLDTKVNQRQSAAVRRTKNTQTVEIKDSICQRGMSAAVKVYTPKEKTSSSGEPLQVSKKQSTPVHKCPPSTTTAVCAKVLLLQRRAKANGRRRGLSSSSGPSARVIDSNRIETNLRIEPSFNFSPVK